MTLIALGLQSLPVELLYELQLFALSENLPLTSHYLHEVFKHASPFFNARYLLGRTSDDGTQPITADIYSRCLRYPMCDQRLLEALGVLMKTLKFPHAISIVQLPRRLFRSLPPPESGWTTEDHPLPLLRYLYENPNMPRINTNSHEGYALTRAVHAKFIPLIEFLLDHHASPKYRDNLAVKVAIRQKDLEMVKRLVERPESKKRKGKRRKTEDRISMDSSLLKTAVMSNANDIVKYLYREKNVIPDVQTLKKMTCS